MRILGKVSLLCCCAALLACSNSSENNGGSASENPAETAYSCEIVTSEESTTSSEEPTSLSKATIPSSESSDNVVHTAGWTLTSEALEETKESTYLEDFEFTVSDSEGDSISFYGDYIQQGLGEYVGMIQLKKDGTGVIECRSLLNGAVTLDVYKRTKYFNSEDHDYTGVPDFYVSSDLTNWNAVEGSKEEGSSNNLIYTFKVTNAYFKFTTKTGNALYLNSVSFSSTKL